MPEEILRIAVKRLSKVFNEFIGECMNEDGSPKAPSQKALIKARGYLPPHCKHSLTRKKEK